MQPTSAPRDLGHALISLLPCPTSGLLLFFNTHPSQKASVPTDCPGRAWQQSQRAVLEHYTNKINKNKKTRRRQMKCADLLLKVSREHKRAGPGTPKVPGRSLQTPLRQGREGLFPVLDHWPRCLLRLTCSRILRGYRRCV